MSNKISITATSNVNALDLLRENHEVETKHFDSGEMVIAIDGRKSDEKCFWAILVNDIFSEVGASECELKPGDVMTWQLEEIHF